MKIEARIFLVVAVFCWVAAIVYGIWTDHVSRRSRRAGRGRRADPVRRPARHLRLVLLVRLAAHRPASRGPPDAEIAEAAGELGFFSPGSYWPIGIAGAATVTGVGPGVRADLAGRSSASWRCCSPSAGCCSSTTSAAAVRSAKHAP